MVQKQHKLRGESLGLGLSVFGLVVVTFVAGLVTMAAYTNAIPALGTLSIGAVLGVTFFKLVSIVSFGIKRATRVVNLPGGGLGVVAQVVQVLRDNKKFIGRAFEKEYGEQIRILAETAGITLQGE